MASEPSPSFVLSSPDSGSICPVRNWGRSGSGRGGVLRREADLSPVSSDREAQLHPELREHDRRQMDPERSVGVGEERDEHDERREGGEEG